MKSIPTIIVGTALGVLSFGSLSSYFIFPNLKDLKKASAYVQNYEGPNPQEALKSLQGELQVVYSRPSIVPLPGIFSDLEKQVSEAIKTSNIQTPSVYKPILKNLGKASEDAAKENSRNPQSPFCGIAEGIAAGIVLYCGAKRYREERSDPGLD